MILKTTLCFYTLVTFFSNSVLAQKLTFSYDAMGNQTLMKYCATGNCSTPLKAVMDSIPKTEEIANMEELSQEGTKTFEEKENFPDDDSASERAIRLFPNPTSGRVGIAIDDGNSFVIKDIYVSDISGRRLDNIQVLRTSDMLDITHFPPATYILNFFLEDGTRQTQKVIKY